jgi:predicted PurR-regulated permease PerM
MSASRYNAEHSNTWAVVLVFGIIAGLYFTRAILVPLAFALTLTFLLTPAVIFLEKLRIRRVLSVMLTLHRWRQLVALPG